MSDIQPSRPRKIAIWGLGAIAALGLAATAASAVTKENAPSVALAIVPQNGFAFERQAAVSAIGEETALREMRVNEQMLAHSIAALRREPLASAALTMVGLSRDAQGKRDDAARIISYANQVDKRQLVANAWLINHEGTQGHDRTVLRLLDEALKVSPTLSAQYMPAFAQALANPETIPAFQELLRSHPLWESGFWSAVSSNPSALPNAQVLRTRILAGPEQLGAVDTQLMDAFVRSGRTDLAFGYGKNLPTLIGDRDNLIRNSSFSELPKLAPLDWELRSDGRIGAAIDEARGTLEINAIAGAEGIVARQLVALQPGSYTLMVKLGQAQLVHGSDIALHIRCAEGRGGLQFTQRLTGDIERPFAVPTTDSCRFYWVDLEFSAMDTSGPALASIAEVRIVPGRATVE